MYDPKVIDHYNNPRNVGSLPKNDEDVGTGIVGAPACGDVMKLQIKVEEKTCSGCNGSGKKVWHAPGEFPGDMVENCEDCKGAGKISTIVDTKFKTFGCGSAIASSSLATELIKGKLLDEAAQIRNTFIVSELKLPPVKIHCSVLAEDAIKAAIEDYKRKRAQKSEPQKTNNPER